MAAHVDASLSLQHRLLIAEQVAEGLIAIHEHGILHRDIAARNIMIMALDADDAKKTVVKVADYGISTMLGAQDQLQTAGATVVPIRWMAPEAIAERLWSKQSDIWSYGGAVYLGWKSL